VEPLTAPGERRWPLPGGRTLHVRPVREDDVGELAALYEGLGEDDLYCRFFQPRVPLRSTIEAMASVEERGGFRLIAEIEDGKGDRRIVGECGYELLPDGDGELGITVARGARGWLGPFLLDLVMEVAAGRGVANLQADVILDNRRMLTVMRARGYATMDHSTCPAVVRAVIGTTGRVPTWPPANGRPRVLVEVAGGRWHHEAAARAAGLQLLVCPGPLSPWSHCPAVAGRPCPLAAGADVIVDAVPSDDALGTALFEAHGRLHSAVPLCVELPARPRQPTVRPSTTKGGRSAPRSFSDDTDETTVIHLLQKMASPGPVGRTEHHRN
jgi:hypothetical protein